MTWQLLVYSGSIATNLYIYVVSWVLVVGVVVDGITGEVLDSQISFVKWQSERFLMMRTTYGVGTIFGAVAGMKADKN